MTVHKRWNAFRGDSESDEDLLFDVKKSSLLQAQTQLGVFLGSNRTEEKEPDFTIQGSWSKRALTVYVGSKSSCTPCAEIMRVNSHAMIVRIQPNIDQAFIAALVAILDGIKYKEDTCRHKNDSFGSSIGVIASGLSGGSG